MKRLMMALGLLAGLAVAGVLVFRMASPVFVVANTSEVALEEVVVQLPSNRIVFGNVQPGTEDAIYYSASQRDGAYRYAVRFAEGVNRSGSCGSLTNSEYGKRLTLLVRSTESIECEESNKLW